MKQEAIKGLLIVSVIGAGNWKCFINGRKLWCSSLESGSKLDNIHVPSSSSRGARKTFLVNVKMNVVLIHCFLSLPYVPFNS